MLPASGWVVGDTVYVFGTVIYAKLRNGITELLSVVLNDLETI